MRIFLAGATGAIGRPLVPLLVADGHDVVGATRTPAKVDALRAAGAEPVLLDALDPASARTAVADARPDAVIHELTALPQRIDPRKMERDFALNDRLRSEGTRYLVEAAQAAGAKRIIAQSIAFAYAPGPPGTVHVESDRLLPASEAHRSYRRSAQAMADLEHAVLGADGLVLRYGYFYGPGTAIARTGSMGSDLARRRLPIVGRGSGVWSFVHIEDAAEATVAALSRGAPGTYNVVDDEPAAVADWLPALADALHARRPLRVPALLARPAAGSYGVAIMTRGQGASNELAKRELGWQPRHPSWREGFRSALG
jgi:nucleoside-diphosphate-sugar epimerase